MAITHVMELLNARRAFSAAQPLLAGAATGQPFGVTLGWHDLATDAEVGSFAVVAEGSPYAELVGDRIQVTVGDVSLFAYVVGARSIDQDFSLWRTTFARVAGLYVEQVDATVQVVA